MAFRFNHLSLFCILSIVMVFLSAASVNCQNPPGHTCIDRCEDAGSTPFCNKTCIDKGYKSGGKCVYNTPNDAYCCCVNN
ncbi:unnamed protein product [Lathyrus oleraceus]